MLCTTATATIAQYTSLNIPFPDALLMVWSKGPWWKHQELVNLWLSRLRLRPSRLRLRQDEVRWAIVTTTARANFQ